ncbi:MAG: phage holin family protein [Chloroflexaceae bacterium]|nr:phage holin family protein [Chloroflexaceae bacterium]NJO06741.1 phage holin family protein [Chloroflexaceae bacterium]
MQQPQPSNLVFWYSLRRIVLRWLISSLAIFAAVWLVPGITFSGPGWQLGVVAAILGLLNSLLRPLLFLFALPLILLTLGLFMLVINAALLALASLVADQLGIAFVVDGFGAAIFGGLIISVVSMILNLLVGEQSFYIRVQRSTDREP